jgi:catechol 2,3-dioxygenase-like lactoylglutathione lyase family enzyme
MPLAVTRCYHVNVNCSDLDRSLAWYVETLGLTTLVRTRPEEPQPGAAFGLDLVQWDAWILQGAAGHSGVVLDLLQWHVPPATGTPRRLDETGFVALVAAAPHLPEGAVPTELVEGGRLVTDPDGTAVIVVEGDPAIAGVVVGCTDVAASRRWYHEVLGLALDTHARPVDIERGFTFHLTDASHPAGPQPTDPSTAAGIEPDRARPSAVAYELGIFRTALFTNDIDGDHRLLVDAGTHCYSPPVDLTMGPGLPALRALFFAGPDGECVELIEPPRT